MNKLKWWFRVVGAWYLLLALLGLYGVFFAPQLLKDTFPFTVNANGARAAGDIWLIFVLDELVIGLFLLWTSREPLKHRSLVWLVVWLEIVRGVVDDLYLISQGYDAAGYIVFIVIHLLIIVTGIMIARQASREIDKRETEASLSASSASVQ